jgi:hypothetical protein
MGSEISGLAGALGALRALDVPAQARASRAPPAIKAPAAPLRVWTPEQRAAIDCSHDKLRLMALAGCGKTAVLNAYSAARPRISWQYLAFNKAMATEAASEFSQHVRATTFHAWAWPKYGADIAHKMDKPMSATSIAQHLKLPASARWLPGYLALLDLALARFTRSADRLPAREHIPAPEWALWRQQDGAREALDLDTAVAHLEQLWWHSQDASSSLVSASPDTAIKRAQLANLKSRYQGLLVDEAQDLSPAMLALVMGHEGPRVRAGDPYQTLYAWRAGGAGGWENSSEHALALTSSHRFGPELADLANPVLASLGCPLRLSGVGPKTLIHDQPVSSPHWILGRTRASLLVEASSLQQAGYRLAWQGDRTWERLAQLSALARLDHASIADPWISGFSDIEAFRSAATDAGLDEWAELATQAMKGDLQLNPELFVDKASAQMVLSTVHQAKGMSLDRVRLLPDLFMIGASDEELRVRYVALTRARHELSLPSSTLSRSQSAQANPATRVSAAMQGDGF